MRCSIGLILFTLPLLLCSACQDAVEGESGPQDSGFGGTGTAGASAGAGSGNTGGTTGVAGMGASGAAGNSGSSGGDSGVGGSAGSSGATSGDFALLFRDDFDALDTSRWQLMTHSWPGNLAKFAANTVAVSEGLLTITLLDAPAGTMDGGEAKPYLGAEVRSFATLTYGKVRARIKFASASAVVSSLVTIYTPWPADNWNELDIECLGAQPSEMQFNAMVYTGALPAPSTPVSPTPDPHLQALGFDASADFHVYEIAWTPELATFSVDDAPVHTWNSRIELMTLPQNILLTIWASSSAAWAGPVTEATAMASASYDWIELYTYSDQ